MKQQLKLTLGKAFSINENKSIYGTFAEIGAGQETVNCFFKAGLASQTVAKSMSAYDMTFSNLIYGKENRYVSCHRLVNMLKHEYRLLQSRLQKKIGHTTRFFAFANTATTISNQNKDPSNHHGWIGLRFQSKPQGGFNDILLHVNCLDKNRLQQHEALGILGVNLIYSGFYHTHNIKIFISSLMENLDTERMKINWISCKGPDMKKFHQAAINLELLKQKISSITFFNSKGESDYIKDSLFQRPLLITTGKIPIKKRGNLLKNISGKTTYLPLFHISLEEFKGKNIVNYVKLLSKQKGALLVSPDWDLKHLKQTLTFYTEEKLFFIISKDDFKNLFQNKSSTSLLHSLGLLFDNNTKVAVYSEDKNFSLKDHQFAEKDKQFLKEYLIHKKNLTQIL